MSTDVQYQTAPRHWQGPSMSPWARGGSAREAWP